MGGSGRVVRASVGTVLLASLFWFLLTCILAHQATEKAATTISSAIDVHRGGPDPNFASKRRVPDGPDPIHNRRARNSREPPTRA